MIIEMVDAPSLGLEGDIVYVPNFVVLLVLRLSYPPEKLREKHFPKAVHEDLASMFTLQMALLSKVARLRILRSFWSLSSWCPISALGVVPRRASFIQRPTWRPMGSHEYKLGHK